MQPQSSQEGKSPFPAHEPAPHLNGSQTPPEGLSDPLVEVDASWVGRLLTWLTKGRQHQAISSHAHTSANSHAADPDQPVMVYMKRFTLYRSPRYGLYLQKIVGSPAQQFHDHPFRTYSLVLTGSYIERVMVAGLAQVERRVAWFNAKKCHSFHHLVSASPGTWVLVLTGRQRQARGFLGGITEGQAHYLVPNPLSAEQAPGPSEDEKLVVR